MLPATGCPSADTTRQLKIEVPSASGRDGRSRTMRSAASSFGVSEAPSGAISVNTSGAIGSLNVSTSSDGAAASIAPSRGSALTNVACELAGWMPASSKTNAISAANALRSVIAPATL